MTGGALTVRGAQRRVAPFALAAALGIAIVVVPPAPPLSAQLVAAMLLAACVLAAGAALSRLPRWAQDALPFVFLAAAALLRDGAGGARGPVGPLALLPVVWIALHGSRRALAAGIAGLGLVFAAPILLVGGEHYPATEWRRAGLWIVVGSLVGAAVQQLVRDIDRRNRTLSTLLRVAQAVPVTREARDTVCAAACEVTGADAVFLYEPGGDRLAVTGSSGSTPEDASVPLDRSEPSGAVECFASGERLFVPDTGAGTVVSRRLAEAAGIRSVLFEPVLRGGDPVGVLVVAWRRPHRPDAHLLEATGALAAEATVAIERADTLARAEAEAATDALTGLGNRRRWETELELAAVRAARDGTPLSIALLDLDHFKAFNDGNGHGRGDDLLRATAGSWHGALRASDVLCRYGGEEFALLLPGCRLPEAERVVATLRPLVTEGQTCSAGVTTWDGREPVGDAVDRADAALYAAKHAGRDTTVARAAPAADARAAAV